MEDLPLLWVAAVLIAVAGLAGCASPGSMASLPPVPSASDTNRYTPGAAVNSSTEVGRTTDNPSIRGDGTTGAPTTRR